MRLSDLVETYKKLSLYPSNESRVDKLWSSYLEKDTPMGPLYYDNDLQRQLAGGKDIILLHATSNIDQIKKDRILLSSGGGLGGVVYCTPVHSDNSPHNLLDFILDEEMPNFIAKQSNRSINQDIGIIAIKIPRKLVKSEKFEVVSNNYLKHGKNYLNAFNRLADRGEIPGLSRIRVMTDLSVEFKKLTPFLELFYPEQYQVSDAIFIKRLESILSKSETVLNFYFETILEYFFLHQDGKAAKLKQTKGELNNIAIKKMVFDLVPELYQGFSTRKFKTKPSAIVKYLNQQANKDPIITNFDEAHFFLYLRWRLSYYIRFILLSGVNLKRDHSYSTAEITHFFPNLAGQLIYKIMQSDSYKIESEFSKTFLNTKASLQIVYYENIPKGELGLRLKGENQGVEFYEARIDSGHLVVLGEKLDLRVPNILVGPSKSIMRNPSHSLLNKISDNKYIPLYILAERKKLGPVQTMDRESLDWISESSRKILYKREQDGVRLSTKDASMLKMFFPKPDWFYSSKHINTIHGQRHIGRVSVFALLICNYLSVSEEKRRAALLAAVVHDLRRKNDNQDIKHGNRAAKWLNANSGLFGSLIDDDTFEDVLTAVKYHNIENGLIPKRAQEESGDVIRILKTADALDRFRLPKTKWWVNIERLEMKDVVSLIPLARYITLRSEYLALEGVNDFDCLQMSINEAGIISK
jgi:hypothetical protein